MKMESFNQKLNKLGLNKQFDDIVKQEQMEEEEGANDGSGGEQSNPFYYHTDNENW